MIGKLCKVNPAFVASPTTALYAAQNRLGLGIILKQEENIFIYFFKIKETIVMPEYWLEIL